MLQNIIVTLKIKLGGVGTKDGEEFLLRFGLNQFIVLKLYRQYFVNSYIY